MHKQLVLAFVCLCLVSAVNLMGICNRGEHFTSTYMPKCEPTCDEPQKNQLMCMDRPLPGCKCNPGLFRDPNDQCISRALCTIVRRSIGYDDLNCRKTEKYILNYSPQCEPTCQNPVKHSDCPYKGGEGCKCRGGYLRNAQGYCVLPFYCQLELPIVDQQPRPNTFFNPYNRDIVINEYDTLYSSNPPLLLGNQQVKNQEVQ